ncbi:MAG: type VI secretion system baseplate subunit TssE [bacterium]
MATPGRGERPVRPSVLDRLIDEEPRAAADPPRDWEQSVVEYRQGVLRDLEWLLNTRRNIQEVPEDLPELRASVFTYGPPDISSLSGDTDTTRLRLKRQIEELIRLFEPRLTGVRVSLGDEGKESRKIRFQVEGLLRMDPDPERVKFDTVLEIASGTFVVNTGGGRA